MRIQTGPCMKYCVKCDTSCAGDERAVLISVWVDTIPSTPYVSGEYIKGDFALCGSCKNEAATIFINDGKRG